MVYNCYIKCQVCGKITRIRLQLGWLDEHPIVVTCGECGTSLSGKVKIRQDHPEFSFSFDNADIVTACASKAISEYADDFIRKKVFSIFYFRVAPNKHGRAVNWDTNVVYSIFSQKIIVIPAKEKRVK